MNMQFSMVAFYALAALAEQFLPVCVLHEL
jgi:hypothetical protein